MTAREFYESKGYIHTSNIKFWYDLMDEYSRQNEREAFMEGRKQRLISPKNGEMYYVYDYPTFEDYQNRKEPK